jgi:hypothetical protein
VHTLLRFVLFVVPLLGLVLLQFPVTASAVSLEPPKIHWSLKTQISRSGEEKTVALGDARQELVLPSGHRCDVTAPARVDTPAAIVFTRLLACTGGNGAPTTGTSASCSVPRTHGVSPIAESGKWFVFLGKEASPLNVTLRCGLVPEG